MSHLTFGMSSSCNAQGVTFTINGTEVEYKAAMGFNFCVVDAQTLEVLDTQHFDTVKNGATEMVAWLNALAAGTVARGPPRAMGPA